MDWLKLPKKLYLDMRFHELSSDAGKTLVCFWCYCCDQSPMGECKNDIQEIAFALRVPEEYLRKCFAELENAGFIDIDKDASVIYVSAWIEYQNVKNSTERSREYRQRQKLQKSQDATPCNNAKNDIRSIETHEDFCNPLEQSRARAEPEKMRKEPEAKAEQEMKMLCETPKPFDSWNNPHNAVEGLNTLWKTKTGDDINPKDMDYLIKQIESKAVLPRIFESAINEFFSRKTEYIPKSINYIYPIYKDILKR